MDLSFKLIKIKVLDRHGYFLCLVFNTLFLFNIPVIASLKEIFNYFN